MADTCTDGDRAAEILASRPRNELIQEILQLRMQLAQEKKTQKQAADPFAEHFGSDTVAATRKNVDTDLSKVCVAKTPNVLSGSTSQADRVNSSSSNPSHLNSNRCSCHSSVAVWRYLLTKADHCFVLMTLLLQLCVYLPTCYPTIAGGDSAEIIAAACTTGASYFTNCIFDFCTCSYAYIATVVFIFYFVFHGT